jgi:hypothetical protein
MHPRWRSCLLSTRKRMKCFRPGKSVSGNGINCQIYVTIAVTKNCHDDYLCVLVVGKELLPMGKLYTIIHRQRLWMNMLPSAYL